MAGGTIRDARAARTGGRRRRSRQETTMVRRMAVWGLVLAASIAVGHAQAPAGPPQGGPGRGAGAPGGGRGGRGNAYMSPEVNADHTITFRFMAPNAQKVT